MKVEVHFESCFSPEQRIQLVSIVGIDPASVAGVDLQLSQIIRRERELRLDASRTPEPEKSLCGAEKVRKHAKALADLMRDDRPLTDYLAWRLALIRRGTLDSSQTVGAELKELAATLDHVADLMDDWPSWDDRARRLSHLGQLPTRWFWPVLFEFWSSRGRPVSISTGGPLFRFVSFIHGVAGFPPPTPATLKDAAAHWRAGLDDRENHSVI